MSKPSISIFVTAVWLHCIDLRHLKRKASQQAQSNNWEIGLHMKSYLNRLHLQEEKWFLICFFFNEGGHPPDGVLPNIRRVLSGRGVVWRSLGSHREGGGPHYPTFEMLS